MHIIQRLIRSIFVSLVVFIVANCLIINTALAINIPAGFGAGTMITTPNGNIAMEDLKPGDCVIGYNFETHRSQENVVNEIKQKSSERGYLSNLFYCHLNSVFKI